MVRGVLVVAAAWALLSVGSAQAVAVPWVNGDFELGATLSDATWTHAESTTFEDADGDGDMEAKLTSCVGEIQLARGLSKGAVPATSHLTFEVEQGGLTYYSFRMILASADDPGAYANNLLNAGGDLLPTYNDDYWFDDQVLAWEFDPSTVEPDMLGVGSHDFDPVDAIAFNIDGWDDMTAEERTQFLSTAVHASLVIYGCADPDAGATLDNFAWDVPTPL